jgi:hypothetical protein
VQALLACQAKAELQFFYNAIKLMLAYLSYFHSMMRKRHWRIALCFVKSLSYKTHHLIHVKNEAFIQNY